MIGYQVTLLLITATLWVIWLLQAAAKVSSALAYLGTTA